MTLGIDEVNTISIEEEIKEYFSVMDITKKQKEEREEAAKDLFPIFLFLFALLGYAEEYDLPYEYVLMQFRMQFGSVAYQYYDDAEEYIDFITKQVLDATLKDNSTLTLKDGEHWVSPERALELSENEANSLLNYQELKNAIQQGKTHKTWVTERDNRVRDDHREMEGKTIPIMEYFHFPDCDMLCPHDVVNGTAKQNSGCRCSLRYGEYEESDVAEREESHKLDHRLLEETKVDEKILDKEHIREMVAALGEDAGTSREIANRMYEILDHRNGTHFEDLAFVDTFRHKSQINKDFDYYDGKMSQCKPNRPMKQLLREANEKAEHGVISIHNHPSSNMVSMADLYGCSIRRYKYGLVITHKGTLYRYKVNDSVNPKDLKPDKDGNVTDEYIAIQSQLDKLYSSLYDGNDSRTVSSIANLKEKGIVMEVFR